MAALGGFSAAGGAFLGSGTDLVPAALNVTGTDLALVAGLVGVTGADTTQNFAWQGGAPDGTFANIDNFNSYYDGTLVGWNDPTPANASVVMDFAYQSVDAHWGFFAFFTAAGDLVFTDSATNTAGSGTSSSITVPNVATDDFAIDLLGFGNNGADATAQETGQVAQGVSGETDGFSRMAASTRPDNGTLTWNVPSAGYGLIHLGARIPNAAGGSTPVTGTGEPSAQSATASGTGEREITASGTPAAQSATVVGAGTLLLSVLLNAANNTELRDENGTVVSNLSNIAYEFYDDDSSTAGTPVDSGTFSTDANGEASLTLTNSTLSSGQFGTLVLFHPSNPDIRGVYRVAVSGG